MNMSSVHTERPDGSGVRLAVNEMPQGPDHAVNVSLAAAIQPGVIFGGVPTLTLSG